MGETEEQRKKRVFWSGENGKVTFGRMDSGYTTCHPPYV